MTYQKPGPPRRAAVAALLWVVIATAAGVAGSVSNSRRAATTDGEKPVGRSSRHITTVEVAAAPAAERFEALYRSSAPSVFLIRSEFHYRAKTAGSTWVDKHAAEWGTAFVISDDGLIVTNKHVVEPWKFDPEFAALVSQKLIEPPLASPDIVAWPCELDASKEGGMGLPLSIAATAADHLSNRHFTIAGTTVSYAIHEPDDHDLVLLRSPNRDHRPIPCAPRRHERGLARRDGVMVLGFPLGHRGLLEGRVESTPAFGEVSDVAGSISITAKLAPGNSGGPLLSDDGLVVGVATRVRFDGAGICIKIDRALELVDVARGLKKAN